MWYLSIFISFILIVSFINNFSNQKSRKIIISRERFTNKECFKRNCPSNRKQYSISRQSIRKRQESRLWCLKSGKTISWSTKNRHPYKTSRKYHPSEQHCPLHSRHSSKSTTLTNCPHVFHTQKYHTQTFLLQMPSTWSKSLIWEGSRITYKFDYRKGV